MNRYKQKPSTYHARKVKLGYKPVIRVYPTIGVEYNITFPINFVNRQDAIDWARTNNKPQLTNEDLYGSYTQ